MRYYVKQVILTIIISLSALCTSAQVNESIDTIVISTSRIPQQARHTGRNVTVVRADDLSKTYATSLDDLLQYIPGIEVQSRSAFGVQGDITMRGATFSQVLLLVDGMRLNDPLTAHFNSYIPVTPAEIDRIEVYRGAAASIYGADAVGGVINIITKGNRIGRAEGQEIQGEINFGNNRLIQAQQGWSINKNNFYLGGGASISQSDGELISPVAADGSALDEYNSYFDIKTIGLAGGYKWNNGWQLNSRLAYDHRDYSARYFYTTSTFDKSEEVTRNWWNTIRLSKIGQKSSTDFNLGYKYNTDVFQFSPDFPSTNSHVSQLLNFNAGHLREINENISLRVGTQIDRRSIESTDRGNHSNWHYGIYAVSMMELSSDFYITPSLRLDYDDNYGVELSPQLNASYNLKDITIRASIGRSIRAGDYTERFVSFNLGNLTPGRSLGNPDLLAESAWSEEIGIDLLLTSNWKIKSTVFFRQSSQLIDYIATQAEEISNNQNLQAGESYFYASNLTEINTKGFELESWWSQTLNPSLELQWSLGYSNINTTGPDDQVSIYVSSHANHLITSQMTLSNPSWEISLTGLFKDRNGRIATGIQAETADSYSVWNTRLKLHLTKEFSAQIQMHNLFDTTYSDILGAPMPGRWLSAGISMNL